uniref:Uncharacterized protein n=1 Tax=Vitrella brassicaformis TaxID=1169539 RepID=A0A7S1K2V5_9ALVE|mmetsp:Transcript_5175/g.14212  ORF Transcript_5175/g.14212 Transcript_5175/m.14212 type:complete len:134 (+) Transcript_5175:159-560(+)
MTWLGVCGSRCVALRVRGHPPFLRLRVAWAVYINHIIWCLVFSSLVRAVPPLLCSIHPFGLRCEDWCFVALLPSYRWVSRSFVRPCMVHSFTHSHTGQVVSLYGVCGCFVREGSVDEGGRPTTLTSYFIHLFK